MKKIVVLVIALTALLAVWYWLSQSDDTRGGGEAPVYATQADTLAVSKLVVKRWGRPDIVMVKDVDGIWQLTEPLEQQANQNIANQLVRGLSMMAMKDMVSDRETMQANFEVDELQAARLQAFHGETQVADVFCGKLAPDMVHVYVRQMGSNEIYAATGGSAMARFRVRELDEFRDHSILSLDLALIDSVYIEAGSYKYGIVRSDTLSWQARIGNGAYKPADRGFAEGSLRGLVAMRASGFADDSTVIDWSRPAARAQIWLLGRDPVSLSMQKMAEGNDYWVKVEGHKYVYKVFESAFKALDRDPKGMFPAS